MLTHTPGDMTEYSMPIFRLVAKHRIPQVFHYLTHNLYGIAFLPSQLPGNKITTLEVSLLEQGFVLVSHDIGLNLSHKIHSHHHNNQ